MTIVVIVVVVVMKVVLIVVVICGVVLVFVIFWVVVRTTVVEVVRVRSYIRRGHSIYYVKSMSWELVENVTRRKEEQRALWKWERRSPVRKNQGPTEVQEARTYVYVCRGC